MIEVKSLTMNYGKVSALKDISFKAETGKILCLLGPNGAGKTTLMRILTTFLYPSRGTAIVGGFDIRTDSLAVRRLIGYLPETVPLYPDMLVKEYLGFIASARNFSGSKLKQRLDWVREVCGLSAVWNYLISEVSKGFSQRIGFAQAIVHDPEIMIMDEPTSSLDPLQRLEMRELIRSLAKNKTVIFSTHILQEAEALAEKIIIIDKGKLIVSAALSELFSRAGKGATLEDIVVGLLNKSAKKDG